MVRLRGKGTMSSQLISFYSGRPKSRLSPYGRVTDAQSALTWLAAQPMVSAAGLGIYGTSYGGARIRWRDRPPTDTLRFHPKWMVVRIAPRPVMYLAPR
jgi:hypothetical protein